MKFHRVQYDLLNTVAVLLQMYPSDYWISVLWFWSISLKGLVTFIEISYIEENLKNAAQVTYQRSDKFSES